MHDAASGDHVPNIVTLLASVSKFVSATLLMAIHEDAADLHDLADDDLDNLAAGIAAVLRYYETLGHLSYNYALYSVRQGVDDGSFRLLLKIITRQNLYANYRNDDYFLQKLLQSELIITPPEELAEQVRGHFKG